MPLNRRQVAMPSPAPTTTPITVYQASPAKNSVSARSLTVAEPSGWTT